MNAEALVAEAVEVISRTLSGMRYAAAAQEDEGVRLVSNLEASQILDALVDADIGLVKNVVVECTRGVDHAR